MKKSLFLLMTVCSAFAINAQQSKVDSLKNALASATDEYTRFKCRTGLFKYYINTAPDSAAPYAQQNIYAARRIGSDSLLFSAFSLYRTFSHFTGDFANALQYGFEAIKAAERTKDLSLIIKANTELSEVYVDQGDYKRGLVYANKAKAIHDSRPSSFPALDKTAAGDYGNLLHKVALAYEKNNELDSALKYIQKAEQLTIQFWGGKMLWPAIPIVYGNIYLKKGDYQKAIEYYRWGFYLAKDKNFKKDVMSNAYGLAITYKKINEIDSSIFYTTKVFDANRDARFSIVQLEALILLANIYKAKNSSDSAAKYFELAYLLRDSLFNRNKMMQMQNQTFNEQVRQQEIQQEQQKLLYRNKIYATLAFAVAIVVIALLLWRNIQHRQKAFGLLQKQKEETDVQKAKAEQTLEELKATQTQLIQSEKMASLGELTAGIAHEIQNPLNFVNNFSEVNKELIEDMEQEIDKGNFQEVKTIANDIKENQQKINHHGKRADAIVNGMLQHSRTSTGQKEPTDINALCDEYLRLCYHGLRAKDKSFNATMKTDFDNSIGKINVIPQDIGRVVLNLLTNAFYAVDEKQKQNIPSYEPTVTIATTSIQPPLGSWSIQIKVTDNGGGIPKKIFDKIFQPFFTTKPTGQGTGLGLSLSYDIVKAHGGELKVETKENEGSIFIIKLPALA